ncbi:hypothetical protein V6N11_074626 [Hibiscus sabdariffa]|uniref:Uncharacterized protein n=1 Tax=Hibiscus sabdariffa TaxID=183260 RepID=A0ABR2R433_9ROSI
MQQLRFGRDSRRWDLIFGATCWYLWLYRNGLVYGIDGTETWSVLAKVRGWYEEHAASLLLSDERVQAAAATGLSGSVSYHSMRHDLTYWCPPTEGWYKLNTDGSGGRGAIGAAKQRKMEEHDILARYKSVALVIGVTGIVGNSLAIILPFSDTLTVEGLRGCSSSPSPPAWINPLHVGYIYEINY